MIPLAYPGIRNILVIQLGDIGDVVLATPTYRALKEIYPKARTTALVRKGYGLLLEADPNLVEVLEVAKSRRKFFELFENFRLVRDLRAVRYDLVIDLRTGNRGAILSLLARAPAKIAFAGDGSFWRRFIFTRLLEELPVAPPPAHPGGDQSLRIVRAIGVDTSDTRPRLSISEAALARAREILASEGIDPGGKWVTVNPFSRWKYKEWGHEKWAEVIRWIRDAHEVSSVVVGSREEAGAASDVLRSCGNAAYSIAGRTTLGELAAVLRLSSLHLGVDSAAPHIAAAVGTPTVTIFGPSDWRSWTVSDDTHRIVTPDMECVPCHRKGCDHTETSLCLAEMGTGMVKKAVEEAFRCLPSPSAHHPESYP